MKLLRKILVRFDKQLRFHLEGDILCVLIVYSQEYPLCNFWLLTRQNVSQSFCVSHAFVDYYIKKDNLYDRYLSSSDCPLMWLKQYKNNNKTTQK